MRRRAGAAIIAPALALVLAGCGSITAKMPDIDALHCPSPAPAAAAAASSLPALASLARKEQTPYRAVSGVGHGTAGAEPPIVVAGHDRGALARELRVAAAVACGLRTPAEAERAGYVFSAAYTPGVGAHYTNWNLIDAPFDPAQPSMLLYGPSRGTTQLIGFSYWVRTNAPAGPDGFVGGADHWHRHVGMCFDATGRLQRESIRDPSTCEGTWINGQDMWMLHAWVVPGAANSWGVFAPLNPQQCSHTGPDISRCPGF